MMNSNPHTCIAGCGKRITWRFALCRACEEKYGNKALLWPEWMRFIWKDIQRTRRRDKRNKTLEVSLELITVDV